MPRVRRSLLSSMTCKESSFGSPITASDPNARVIFSGPNRGIGSTLTWDGSIAGSGTQRISESRPFEFVETIINAGEPGESRTWFDLEEKVGLTTKRLLLGSAKPPSYNRSSFGSFSRSALSTVSPPTPESKTPIGRGFVSAVFMGALYRRNLWNNSHRSRKRVPIVQKVLYGVGILIALLYLGDDQQLDAVLLQILCRPAGVS